MDDYQEEVETGLMDYLEKFIGVWIGRHREDDHNDSEEHPTKADIDHQNDHITKLEQRVKSLELDRRIDQTGEERVIVEREFWECPECKAKPGSPLLCPSCLHNRFVIDLLNDELEYIRKVVGGHSKICAENS